MAGELLLGTGTPPLGLSGYVKVYAGADRRVYAIDAFGNISVLSEMGLQDLNLLDNSGFLIQQRVAVAATAIPGLSLTTRAGQVADRWAVTTGNVTTTQWQQVDTGSVPEAGLTSKFYGKIIQITNAAKFILSQFKASEDIVHLRGSKVRVSVKIKRFVGADANYRLGLLQLTAAGTIDVCPAFISAIGGASIDPTWGTNLAMIPPDATPIGENGAISGNALTITSTSAWVRSSAVFSVPTDCKNLCVVLYRDTIGAANDALGVSEFQLTQGSDIIDFVSLPREMSLFRCQRYFNKSFGQLIVPAQNLGVTTGILKWSVGVAGAVAGNWGYFPFPVVMWKIPTIILFNPAAANAQARQLSATAGDCTTSSGAEITDRGFGVTCTPGATAVIGSRLGVHYTAEAEFIT